MLRRAQEACLSIPTVKVLEAKKVCQPDAPISENLDPEKDPLRKIAPGDLVHESVKPRGHQNGMAHNGPPAGVTAARGWKPPDDYVRPHCLQGATRRPSGDKRLGMVMRNVGDYGRWGMAASKTSQRTCRVAA